MSGFFRGMLGFLEDTRQRLKFWREIGKPCSQTLSNKSCQKFSEKKISFEAKLHSEKTNFSSFSLIDLRNNTV